MVGFASAADLAARLDRTLTDAERAQAEAILGEVSAVIRGYTGQQLTRATSTVRLVGTFAERLVLPQRPVVAVHQVLVDEVGVTDYLLIGSVLYRAAGWNTPAVTEVGRDWWQWPDLPVRTAVDVSYTHGYDQVLDDVRAVCLEAAVRRFTNPTSVASENAGALSVSYPADRFSDDERRILDRYRTRTGSVTFE